jgi:hypothetical protein
VLFPSVMNKKPSTRRSSLSGGICLLLLAGAAFALASGCSTSEAAPSRGSGTESVPVGAGPKSETETYVAEMKVVAACKAGAECTVEVTLVPKGAYHTNEKYPYKWKAPDPVPEGISYPKPLLQRADGSFEEKRASFKVPFTAAKPGKVTVSGTLSMSVCSEANCIMDKVPLEVAVDVK